MTASNATAGKRLFSETWERFARPIAQDQDIAAARSTEVPTQDAPAPEAPASVPVDLAPARTEAAASTTEPAQSGPATGRRLSATVAASASISAALRPSIAERCFNGLSYAAFLALPLLLLAQFAVSYAALTPWMFPLEAQFAEAYELMSASGDWLTAPAALPPVWFWLLRFLDTLPYVNGALTYTAGAALSGVLVVLATWFLALSAGYGRRAAFAAGLALLSCLAFPALAYRVGPEWLFTGLLTLGLACLLRGWNAERSFLWLPLGCACVALAGLTNGLFGIILPVLGSLIFLLWKGAFARFNKLDGAIAFAILLALPLAWLGAVMLFGPNDAHVRTLCQELITPFLPPYWPPRDPAWFYAATLALALAPWILAPFCVSWGSALARPFSRLAATRKEHSGSAWIWIHLVVGLLLLSAMSAKFCLQALPLVPLLAIVLGKTIVNLPQANSRAFFLVPAVLFALAGLALGLLALAQVWPMLRSLAPLPWPDALSALKGLPLLAGICLLAALAIWKGIDRRFPGACLLACAVALTLLCLPARMLTTPGMQDIFLDKVAAPQSAPELPAATTPPAREAAGQTTPPATQDQTTAPEATPTEPAVPQEPQVSAPQPVQEAVTPQEETAAP